MINPHKFLALAGISFVLLFQIDLVHCKGTSIGRFHSFMHGVKGYVSVMDEQTLEISGMTYDGEGPGSWFVVGNDDDYTKEFVDLDATVVPDESNSCGQLRRYSGETIQLKLPGKVTDYSYLSIYCLKFNHNFGYVGIPSDVSMESAAPGARNTAPCEGVDTSDAAQNREPTCTPWPGCWKKPNEKEEDDEGIYTEEEDK